MIAEELEADGHRRRGRAARVDRIQNHLADKRTEMLDGARWRWCAEEHGEAEDAILAELARASRPRVDRLRRAREPPVPPEQPADGHHDREHEALHGSGNVPDAELGAVARQDR